MKVIISALVLTLFSTITMAKDPASKTDDVKPSKSSSPPKISESKKSRLPYTGAIIDEDFGKKYDEDQKQKKDKLPYTGAILDEDFGKKYEKDQARKKGKAKGEKETLGDIEKVLKKIEKQKTPTSKEELVKANKELAAKLKEINKLIKEQKTSGKKDDGCGPNHHRGGDPLRCVPDEITVGEQNEFDCNIAEGSDSATCKDIVYIRKDRAGPKKYGEAVGGDDLELRDLGRYSRQAVKKLGMDSGSTGAPTRTKSK